MDLTAWDLASVLVKTITYAATLCAAGGAAFRVQHSSALSTTQNARLRCWLGACVSAAVVASTLRIGVLSGSMGGDLASVFDGGLARMVLEAGEGRATAVRAMGLLAIAVSLVTRRRSGILALVGATAAATSFAWVGHAWAAVPGPASVVVLSVHIACVAFWLGALVPLWMQTEDEDLHRIAAITRSFGVAAIYVVAVLLLAGVLLLAVLLSAPSELWTSAYGRLVTIKLVAVAGFLSVAAFNKLRLTPRLVAEDRRAVIALRRSIRVEIAIALVILLLTASFTTVVGPVFLD